VSNNEHISDAHALFAAYAPPVATLSIPAVAASIFIIFRSPVVFVNKKPPEIQVAGGSKLS